MFSVGSKVNLLLPSVFFTLCIFLGTAFFLLKSENQKISLRVFIVYSIAAILLSALASLVGFMDVEKPVVNFIILQALFFVFGIVHAIMLYRLNNSWAEKDAFLHELVFTIYVALLAGFVFLFVYQFINRNDETFKLDYTLFFAWSVIFVAVPYLLLKTADYALAIPTPEYPKWYYPVNETEFEIPDEYFEDKNIIVVEFHVAKNPDEPEQITKSKAKAPLKLEFGKYFTYFLYGYNDDNPGEPIKFVDEYRQPHGWNFYIKSNKWYQAHKYIDPDLSIRENEINDRDIIIAERV